MAKKRSQHDEIRTRIRAAGLRATASRIATLEVVGAADGPLSHADVAEALADRGIDRATVYRNLTDLADARLLIRSHIGRAWSFEVGDAHEGSHPHFVCNECGDIECLTDVEIQLASKGGNASALPTNTYTVELSGRCNDCD